MKRQRQSLEELLGQLSPVDNGWQDAHAEAVIQQLNGIPQKPSYTRDDLACLLPMLNGANAPFETFG